jgi:hypothetical protein
MHEWGPIKLVTAQVIEPHGLFLVANGDCDRRIGTLRDPAKIHVPKDAIIKIVLEFQLTPVKQLGTKNTFQTPESGALAALTVTLAAIDIINVVVVVLQRATHPDAQRAKQGEPVIIQHLHIAQDGGVVVHIICGVIIKQGGDSNRLPFVTCYLAIIRFRCQNPTRQQCQANRG